MNKYHLAMSSWFKEFFYYTRQQQIAIIILLALIVVVIIGVKLYQYSNPPTNTPLDSTFIKQALLFRDTLRTYQPYSSPKNVYRQQYKVAKPIPKPFDPNKTDSATLVSIGFKPFLAKNLIHYRNKGGTFKQPDDLKRLYGMSEDFFNTIRPYIHIDTTMWKHKAIKQGYEAPPPIVIELNSADTSTLQQLKGIGPVLAQRIVQYRLQLGGYSELNQLLEVYGITPELFTSIASVLTVCRDSIKPIKINRASIERLKHHPYLSFYDAQTIYEYRRKQRYIYSFDELKQLSTIADSTLQRIEPYLDFSIPAPPTKKRR